jgi:hypothetical protein
LDVSSHQIVIISPGELDHIKSWNKNPVLKLYMPLWKKEEVENCLKNRKIGNLPITLDYLYSKLVPCQLSLEFNNLFRKYGLESKSPLIDLFGFTMRFLLKRSEPIEELHEVFRNMLCPDLENSFNRAKWMNDNNELIIMKNHHLFHMDASEDYKSYHSKISGRKVEEAIKKQFRTMSCEYLFDMYQQFTMQEPRYSYVVGGVFEILLENSVREKKGVIIREFKPAKLKLKKITINMNDIFDNIDRIEKVELENLGTKTEIKENVLYCQDKSNWEAIDDLLYVKNKKSNKLCYLFGLQITVGKTHSINPTGIKKIKTIIDNFEIEKKKELFYIHVFIVQNSKLFLPPKNIKGLEPNKYAIETIEMNFKIGNKKEE